VLEEEIDPRRSTRQRSRKEEIGVAMDGAIVRFVTSMSTNGLFDGSWARFVGMFVQIYAYPNVSGGETQALLSVGAFDLAENRR
jgi:hypothetical protein